MTTKTLLLIALGSLIICSCASDRPSAYKPPVKLYKGVDYSSFVRIAAIDPARAEHVMKLFDSNGIPNVIEGSVVYGVFVPPKKKDEAIKILKADSQKHKYYVKF